MGQCHPCEVRRFFETPRSEAPFGVSRLDLTTRKRLTKRLYSQSRRRIINYEQLLTAKFGGFGCDLKEWLIINQRFIRPTFKSFAPQVRQQQASIET